MKKYPQKSDASKSSTWLFFCITMHNYLHNYFYRVVMHLKRSAGVAFSLSA